MEEAYCGKTCADCAEKKAGACPGCQEGPGKMLHAECEIARCCQKNRHDTCATCTSVWMCDNRKGRYEVPERRRKAAEEAKIRKAEAARRSEVLGKWLWIAFWLIIPNTIGTLMANDKVVELLPFLYLPGELLQLAGSIAYGCILWKLRTVEDSYRTASLCMLICSGSLLVLTLICGAEPPSWSLLITVPLLFVGFKATYEECSGHEITLNGIDSELSERWGTQWKYEIGFECGIIGASLLSLFGALIRSGLLIWVSLLGMVVCAIGMIVFAIKRLILLYKSANCFQAYYTYYQAHEE